MDIIALKEKCIIGLYYQYVGVANVLVLSPVQWSPANPRLAPTCAVSNVGTPGVLTNNYNKCICYFSFLCFNSRIIFNNSIFKGNSSPLLLLCCGQGFAVWRSDAGFLRLESREHKLCQLKWQYYVYSFIIKVNIALLRHSWKLSQLRARPVNTLHAGCITVVTSSGQESETWKKPWHFEKRGHKTVLVIFGDSGLAAVAPRRHQIKLSFASKMFTI